MKLILEAIKSLFRKIELSRTHYDDRQYKEVKVTFDGNLEGREIHDFGDGTYVVKISDEAPTPDMLDGATGTIYDGGEYFSATSTEDDIYQIAENLYAVFEVVVVALADCEFNGFAITKGIWGFVGCVDSVPVFYPASLVYTEEIGELKKLDEKYLPDGLATVADVKKAQAAAENAQTTAETAQATADKQADWNEADESSPSYVKNRTHYIEDYLREFTPAQYGPVGLNGFVFINQDVDAVNALAYNPKNVTVEYKYDEASEWATAKIGYVSDTRVHYKDSGNTDIFWYDVANKRFLNNFTNTSKANLYIRLSGTVPDKRYHKLDSRFLPDGMDLTMLEDIAEAKENASKALTTAENASKYVTCHATIKPAKTTQPTVGESQHFKEYDERIKTLYNSTKVGDVSKVGFEYIQDDGTAMGGSVFVTRWPAYLKGGIWVTEGVSAPHYYEVQFANDLSSTYYTRLF